ncbi:hypothetical protein MMC26_001851 [Xylographa opegraphella]|nr:hypothetical protein [Xylographa opegraphella]
MPKVLAAITSPINPPSSSPVLTIPQIWAGLILKCKEPQHFVAAMSDCKVTSESETQIVRLITIGKEGIMGPPGTELRERIELAKPMQADFFMDNGTHISNIVSVGSVGSEDLYMTFTFDIVAPEGTDTKVEHANTLKAGHATVKHTIEIIRGLVKEGKL